MALSGRSSSVGLSEATPRLDCFDIDSLVDMVEHSFGFGISLFCNYNEQCVTADAPADLAREGLRSRAEIERCKFGIGHDEIVVGP